jgi:hypothetical protein
VTITVTLKDANDNLVVGCEVKLESSNDHVKIDPESGDTASNGEAKFKATTTEPAENVKFTAKFDGPNGSKLSKESSDVSFALSQEAQRKKLREALEQRFTDAYKNAKTQYDDLDTEYKKLVETESSKKGLQPGEIDQKRDLQKKIEQTLDPLFAIMQLAKAAEAGLLDNDQVATSAASPSGAASFVIDEQDLKLLIDRGKGNGLVATIADIERAFGYKPVKDSPWLPNKIGLYLELLEVTDDKQGVEKKSTYYATAIGAKDLVLGTHKAEYMPPSCYPGSGPAELVTQAMNGLKEGGSGTTILIAPDHAVCSEGDWKKTDQHLRAAIKPPIAESDKKKTDQQNWFAYVPTAAAIVDGTPWNYDKTEKYWLQLVNGRGTQKHRIDRLLGVFNEIQAKLYIISSWGTGEFRGKNADEFARLVQVEREQPILPFFCWEASSQPSSP